MCQKNYIREFYLKMCCVVHIIYIKASKYVFELKTFPFDLFKSLEPKTIQISNEYC